MNWQEILVLLLFVLAVWFIGRMMVNQLKSKSASCGSQCKCGADFSSIPDKLQK